MAREIGARRALWNGVAALAILLLGGAGAVQVASRHWHVQDTFSVSVRFRSISGLEPGGAVYVQGINAGAVDRIDPPLKPGEPVLVRLRVDERLKPLVRSDAVARVVTQGVVGARVVEITPGKADAAPLTDGASIASEEPIELAQIMTQVSQSLAKVDSVAVQAETGVRELNEIASGIREGKGTLGRLVRDDEAYDRLMSVTDRGEQTLQDLNDNLVALKHIWPISTYFNGRGYDDRDRVLYKPGSRRDSRTLGAGELFEPGGAILSDGGRKRLDALGTWLSVGMKANTEVVVAAFGEEGPTESDVAQLLTQEQAEAVKGYLITRHKVNASGWFRTRKVAAVGFGARPPRVQTTRTPEAMVKGARVEVILFTPQSS